MMLPSIQNKGLKYSFYDNQYSEIRINSIMAFQFDLKIQIFTIEIKDLKIGKFKLIPNLDHSELNLLHIKHSTLNISKILAVTGFKVGYEWHKFKGYEV